MKILLLFFFLLPFSFLFSQGNLQFNRVFTYNLTGSFSVSAIVIVQTVSITVPPNKVWKIESASDRVQGSQSYFNGSGGTSSAIVMDNNILHLSRSSPYSDDQTNLPLWLAEGTHSLQLIADNLGTSCTGCIAYGMISGIEFNIIP